MLGLGLGRSFSAKAVQTCANQTVNVPVSASQLLSALLEGDQNARKQLKDHRRMTWSRVSLLMAL